MGAVGAEKSTRRAAAKLALLALLLSQFVALAPGALIAQRPKIRIVACVEDRPLGDLDGCIDTIVRSSRLALGRIEVTDFSSEDAPFGAMPVPETWDLALLVPGPLLDTAHEKGQLAALEVDTREGKRRRPWLVVDVSVYGLVELGPSLRPRAWTDLNAGLMIPDLEREPGFLDIVAGLRERREIADFSRVWWSARASRTSAEIRAWENTAVERRRREADAVARPLAILRLRDDEIPSFEELPTVRLGLAVSARAPEAIHVLAIELAKPANLERWLGAPPRLRQYSTRLNLPPTSARVRAARDFVYRRYQSEQQDLPDWLNTLLLSLFVAVFVYVIVRSAKMRGRRAR